MFRQLGRNGISLAAAIGILGTVAWPVQAQAPELRMLDSLAHGAWKLHIRDDGSSRSICVRDGRELIQLEHRGQRCHQFIDNDSEHAVAVQYNCERNGYGRTTIRSEGNKLVQIRTQGIRGGTPFSYSAEGRYAGSC